MAEWMCAFVVNENLIQDKTVIINVKSLNLPNNKRCCDVYKICTL